MKRLLIIAFSLAALVTFGQKNQLIELKWKIAPNEKLSYSTVMKEIDTSSAKFDIGSIFKSLADSTENGRKASEDYFRKFNQAFKNLDYVTTLTNKGGGVVDIVMRTKPKEQSKTSETDTTAAGLLKLMQEMNQGIVLRGAVYETGGIQSFWVKSSQKNLIALFFELPTKPVKIGDKWSLDISLINNDQNFDCDSSYKVNEITLTDIKKVNGETIAFLKYNIAEYVKGKFNTPSFMSVEGGSSATMMKFSHQGIASFSVDKGRWITYDGIMSLDATGIMTANQKTKLTLIEESAAK